MNTKIIIEALIIYFCILAWGFGGYRIVKSKKSSPHRFALYLSIGLGLIVMLHSFLLIPMPEALWVGLPLFFIDLLIGYPIGLYFSRKWLKVNN